MTLQSPLYVYPTLAIQSNTLKSNVLRISFSSSYPLFDLSVDDGEVELCTKYFDLGGFFVVVVVVQHCFGN